MLKEDKLRTDKYTLADGTSVYVLTHLPTQISARDEEVEKPVTVRLAHLRKRLEVCVDALATSGIKT